MAYNTGVSLDAYHKHIAADIGKTSQSGAEWWNVVTNPAWHNSPYCVAGLQAGLVELGAKMIANGSFYCPTVESWARSQGIWVDGSSTARRGDFGLCDWGGDGKADHIVFIEKDNGDTLQTIEYNTSSGMYGSQSDGRGVWRRTRERRFLKGFVRLSWSGAATAPAPTTVSTLALGSRGDRVVKLQKTMNLWFPNYENTPLATDGVFGRGTEGAVKQYQRARRLSPVDGRFGPMSRADFAKVTGVWV